MMSVLVIYVGSDPLTEPFDLLTRHPLETICTIAFYVILKFASRLAPFYSYLLRSRVLLSELTRDGQAIQAM